MGLLDLFQGGAAQAPSLSAAPPPDPFSQFDTVYDEASKETGVPAAILKAQTMQESRFNPEAIGRSGEVGLLQIKPSTAAQPGYGVEPVDPTKLADPAENIRFGARYLAARARDAGVQDWNDPAQVAKGLAAYNGGGDPNYAQNVFRHLKPPGGAQAPAAAPQAQPTTPAWGAPVQQPAQASEPFAVRDISHLGQFNWGKIEKPEGIVIHHTGGRGTPEGIMNVFKQRGLATQYIMDRDGNVHRALPEGAKGRHLKPSEINGLSNSNAIGIEIIAKDDSDLTDAQRASAAKWLAATQSKYNIPAANVFGHGEVNSHKQRTEGSTIVSAWRAANGIEGVPSVNIARAQSSGQPLNPTVTAAAERGRGPAADRPARAAAYVEGQMPMARRQMVDTTSADNAGVLEFLRQQIGQGQETMPAEAQGGLGGLGGFRIPGVGGDAASGAPAETSIEALIPPPAADPFALFGARAQRAQQAQAEWQGKVFTAKQLVSQGMSPQDAVAAINSPALGQQLALGGIKQRKEAAVNADVSSRLAGGGAPEPEAGPVAAPQPVSPGGAVPAPEQTAEAAPAAKIDTGNKTVDALFAKRDAKLREYRQTSDMMIRATTDAAKSAVSARLKAIENEIGGLDERMKQYAPTGTMKEYVFAMGQRQQQGLPVIPMEQFDQEQRKASKTEVNVKTEGSIPPGYQVERDAQGQPLRMIPIPGGPADVEAKEKAAKLDLTKKQAQTTGNVVLSALDDIDRLMKTATLPTTGALGARVSEIGGTASHDIASALTTIKANISFDRLQQMRAASPTGGALGGVAVEELRALQNSAAAVEQSQSPEQFKLNLGRLREQYNLVVHGPQTTRPDGSSPPKPTAAPSISDGARAKGPNGQVIVLRNGQWVPE